MGTRKSSIALIWGTISYVWAARSSQSSHQTDGAFDSFIVSHYVGSRSSTISGSVSPMPTILRVALLLLASSHSGSAEVSIGHPLEPRQPQLAAGQNGTIHLTFGSGAAVYYCSSTNAGRSFSSPTQVGTVKFLSLGMRRGPRVALTDQAIVVTAVGGEKGGGRDGDLLAWRSNDDGRTWSGPVSVNDVTAAAREGLHSMAAGPGGLLFCTWLDLRNNLTEVSGSSSRDGGATWSRNVLVYHSPDGSVCECCDPSIACAADGNLFVMWRNALNGNRDMYFATSRNSGLTFASARRLGSQAWPLDACPMDGGAIAVDREGQLHAVWRRDRAVYLTQQDATREKMLGRGEQPCLSLTGQGAVVAWVARRPGELMVMLPGKTEPLAVASAAVDPVVVAVQQSVVIAWETKELGRPAIKVKWIAPDEQ